MRSSRFAVIAAIVLIASSGRAARAADDPKGLEFFENKIRPVLVRACYECHSATSGTRLKGGGLFLDSKDGMLKGGNSGPAIVPFKPAESLLMQAIRHEKLKMPNGKPPLPPDVIADFETWIAQGAPDSRVDVKVTKAYKRLSLEEAKTFWSFVPVQKPPVPKVKDTAWPKNDADRFILAKLEEKGLRPTFEADRPTLIRRLSFDLTGLPPTPAELDAFLADNDPKAVEKLVDRLLASPRFGERWARYWLDVVRYAESNGSTDNASFPEAWRYRNWAIKAVNEDKPYDRFIREQIAGDLLPSTSKAMHDDLLVATGFLALTAKPRAQKNPEFRFDLIADQIDVTTRSVLALSVMCARCHDHKFEPISTKEYYSLAGIFDSSVMLFGANIKSSELSGWGGYHDLSDGGQAMGEREGHMNDCRVCLGGDSSRPGEMVPRAAYLRVAALGKAPQPITKGSGRLELAEWLTARENPLTARVAVNRIWMHLFGRAIVGSPDNFGFLGDKPSHPELLDYLAAKFMDDGWSLKKLVRYLVLSSSYLQACTHNEAAYNTDPDNVLRWRMSQRRLDAEAFRDAIMFISGELDLTMFNGGNIVEGMNTVGVAKVPITKFKDTKHRSIYIGIVRGAPLPEALSLFDVANPNIIVAQRDETTVPAQALYLMNHPIVIAHSKATAQLLLNQKDLDDAGRIDLAYRKFFARTATSAEKERAMRYLAETSKEFGDMKRLEAWASYFQMLIASAEFRYVR
jgi:hypothetical protein